MPNQQPMKRDDQHDHSRIEVTTRCSDCGQELGHQTFNRADLETQQMSELPNREAMSLVNANVAAPINAALALNVLSDGSIAQATATQYAPISQPIQ
jgi:peptide methionine sulfoxide reductase MsrB